MKKTIIVMIAIIGAITAAGFLYNNYLTAQYKSPPAYIVDHNAHHR